MDEIEKLTAILQSKEGMNLMDKCVQEMIEKQKKQKEIIKHLLFSSDYIKWLIDFTKDKMGFFDDDWDYSNVKLTDEDQKNVNNLTLFFEGIYGYAKKNYIYSSPRPFGEYYQIKFGDNAFEIGYITGQGTSFYCQRIDISDDCKYIDFNDIINDKEQANVKTINDNLDNLSNMIVEIYNSGVPIEAISEVINKTIRNLAKKDIEEEKVYCKKIKY